jgi:CRISPR-associated protein Csy1
MFYLHPVYDAVASRIEKQVAGVAHCPRWLPSQIEAEVRAQELDVLVYPELGMDATTFALAALRLAPLQCAGWGHPVTTGHPTIDVFFTSAAMEPADGEAHYGERLVRLPGIGTSYAMPEAPPPATRAELGLPEDGALLLCPQSLFKIHPDDDVLFARVLAAAPAARLVLFEGRHPAVTAKSLARLDRTLAAAGVDRGGRVLVRAPLRHDEYLRLNQACDAMLDTTRWSGGNTSLDAIAVGLPMVTLPGRFMRARQSAGMLGLMGIGELVARDADDYLRIAARLAQDRPWRDACSARLAAERGRIFDDRAPVAALADALLSLV